MNNSRRIGAAVTLAAAAVGMAMVTTTAPAIAAPRGPQPVSSWLRAVRAHSDNFVNISWRTDTRICDVAVKVAGRDLDVDYPGHRRYTSFRRSDSLRPGRTDSTLVIVNPDVDRASVARLRVAISFNDCGRRARTRVNTFNLALPVLRNGRPGQGGPGGNGGWPGGNGWPGGTRPTTPSTTTPTTATTPPTTAPTTTVPTTAPTTTTPTGTGQGNGGQGGNHHHSGWGNR